MENIETENLTENLSENTAEIPSEKTEKSPSRKSKKFYTGTGRRKSSVASTWLYNDKGEIRINGKLISDYFTDALDTLRWVAPFHAIGIAHPQAKFSASVKVYGGGKKGQLEAVTLSFARAIVDYDPTSKAILRSNNLLTRDSRKVERKKPFLSKARKRPQYSKR